MLTHKTKLIARIDPLKYLLNKATLTGRLAKWVMILSEFDIEYVDRKAIKGQAIADQLEDAPMIDDVPLQSEFPNESILTISPAKPWQLYFDGSYTQHGAGAGILFITPQGDSIPKSYRLSFPCTNNIAEYEALTTGLRIAVQWKIQELRVFGDSQLVIRQATDDYQTKDEKLMPYKQLVDDLKQHFAKIEFEQIPREQNRAADAMATIASLIDLPQNETCYEFLVDNLLIPSYEITPMEMICVVSPES